ncbi:hypothetical protein ACWF9G_23060 [Nocardia sp. NPDC055029]
MQVHLVVAFPIGLVLDFRAEPAVAATYAADMKRRYGDVQVTIDRAVTATMRLLPCHQLFEA